MGNSLEIYRCQLGSAPELTSEWFEPVLRDYLDRSEAAQKALLLASLPLVVEFVLSRRQHYALPDLDLIQEGNAALPAALERFSGLDVFAYREHVIRCVENHLAPFRVAL